MVIMSSRKMLDAIGSMSLPEPFMEFGNFSFDFGNWSPYFNIFLTMLEYVATRYI